MEQVYIFDFGDKIKAGYSTSVDKRLRTIELSSGIKAKQVYSVNASRNEEKLLHSWLNNRLEGEFFAFPFNDAKAILDAIAKGDITQPPPSPPKQKNGRLQYKVNLLDALKEKGFTTYQLRKDKLLSEGAIQSLRTEKPISWANIEQVCHLLGCQPGDILEIEGEV